MRSTFADLATWEEAWNDWPLLFVPDYTDHPGRTAAVVGSILEPHGFKYFHNGGTPLLERRFGDIWQEIVFSAAPQIFRKLGAPVCVRVHLCHRAVQEIRSQYWRPSSRAPLVIASGDLGHLEVPPVHTIWPTAEPGCGGQIAEAIIRHAIPWFELFEEPEVIRDRISNGVVPLIDDSTSLELLLALFGHAEARRFLRKWRANEDRRGRVSEPSGHDLASDRIAAICAYYRLG